MSDPAGPLDSWPAIIVGVMAGAAALLVPLTGFVKTLLDFKVAYRNAEALKPNVARDMAPSSGMAAMYGSSVETQDLAGAIRELAAAIIAATAAEKQMQSDEMSKTLKRLTDKIEELEATPRRR